MGPRRNFCELNGAKLRFETPAANGKRDGGVEEGGGYNLARNDERAEM